MIVFGSSKFRIGAQIVRLSCLTYFLLVKELTSDNVSPRKFEWPWICFLGSCIRLDSPFSFSWASISPSCVVIFCATTPFLGTPEIYSHHSEARNKEVSISNVVCRLIILVFPLLHVMNGFHHSNRDQPYSCIQRPRLRYQSAPVIFFRLPHNIVSLTFRR